MRLIAACPAKIGEFVMKSKEFQIIIKKYIIFEKPCYSYTAQERTFGFLWRGRWKTLTPIEQSTYDKARALVKLDNYDDCS